MKKVFILLWTILMIGAVITLPGCGGGGGGGSHNTDEPATYSITGQITSNNTGLAGVIVSLSGADTYSTMTDVDGNYSFTGLNNGNYTVTPSLSGYSFSPSDTIVSIDDADSTDIDFTATASATPTYTISGTVSGAVVSGVSMTLTGTGSSATTTDAGGNYSFSGAANGSYTITPSKTGYTFSPATRSITVNNANVTGQNFTATAITTPTYIIAGTVSGAVKSGVTINLSGAKIASTTTDAVGNYSFSGLANGIHTITPSKTGYTFSPTSINVSVYNANIMGQNFTATANIPSTYSISGNVSGAATSGVTITLTGSGSSTTTTDAGGNYSFSGAANGNYAITPSKTGYTFSPATRSITVNNANVTGQNFSAAVSSTTYLSAGGVPVSGYPNWQERAVLVVTNAVRQAPQAYRSTYTSFTNILLPANYPAVAPAYWNENLNHAARAHATDMATTPCFQHNSCNGADGLARISSYYPSAMFLAENIAAGLSSPKAAIDLLICESANPANCATDKTTNDGHRQNIMSPNAKELGAGYYYYASSPYGYYWVQDFGATALPIFQPPIVAGAHMALNAQQTFWLNYYAAAAPQEVRLVINGSTITMTLAIGSAQSGLYSVTAGADSVCQSYHFEAVDSSGQGWRYPGTGEFRTYGINSCTEDYRN
ncbi:MAG: carboxypeptidase regulatory-like domain-containing protein [Smithella sp.]